MPFCAWVKVSLVTVPNKTLLSEQVIILLHAYLYKQVNMDFHELIWGHMDTQIPNVIVYLRIILPQQHMQ